MRNVLQTAALAAAMLATLPFAACAAPMGSAPPEMQEVPQTQTPSETQTQAPPEEQKPSRPETPPEEQTPDGGEAQEERQAVYLRVLVNGLNVREGADAGSRVLGQAEKGVLLGYSGDREGYFETRYLGKTAFVSANPRYTEKVCLEAGGERTEKIAEEGEKLLGTPYVYGAVRLHDGTGRLLKNFTAAQFDCSSLMQYIFYRGAGIVLDVTTRTQIRQGEGVAWEDIRRGDLLFFTNASRKDRTGVERVGHVALYLGGNYILHTASDFAKIEPITPLRKSYFLEARRL